MGLCRDTLPFALSQAPGAPLIGKPSVSSVFRFFHVSLCVFKLKSVKIHSVKSKKLKTRKQKTAVPCPSGCPPPGSSSQPAGQPRSNLEVQSFSVHPITHVYSAAGLLFLFDFRSSFLTVEDEAPPIPTATQGSYVTIHHEIRIHSLYITMTRSIWLDLPLSRVDQTWRLSYYTARNAV